MVQAVKPRILFVDDDLYAMQGLVELLLDAGYEVSPATSTTEALDLANTEIFEAAIVDVRLPAGAAFSATETAGGYKTGIALARELRNLLPGIRILALTLSTDPEVEEWFTSQGHTDYLLKPVLPRELLRRVAKLLRREQEPPQVFIVHGRDERTVHELNRFLEDELGFPAPIILAEKPSRGMTIIEKFEHYAERSDIVFVVVTPDDIGHLVGHAEDALPRPRMNVLFELGYFLGALRREAGRVFLLKKGTIEMPSDLSGVVSVDISKGIAAAAVVLRRELVEWL